MKTLHERCIRHHCTDKSPMSWNSHLWCGIPTGKETLWLDLVPLEAHLVLPSLWTALGLILIPGVACGLMVLLFYSLPCKLFICSFVYKQRLQISNVIWIKRTRGATLGQLQCAMGWDNLRRFPSIVATREHVPLELCHSSYGILTTFDFCSQIPIVTAIPKWEQVTIRFFDDFCTFSRAIFEIPHCWGQSRGKRLHSSPSCIWLSKAKTHFLGRWSNFIVSESGWGYKPSTRTISFHEIFEICILNIG